MPNLLLRDLPPSLHSALKKAAEASGRSLSEEARQLIKKGLSVSETERLNKDQSPWNRLRSLIGDDWSGDGSVELFLSDAEEARRAPPRAIDDFE